MVVSSRRESAKSLMDSRAAIPDMNHCAPPHPGQKAPDISWDDTRQYREPFEGLCRSDQTDEDDDSSSDSLPDLSLFVPGRGNSEKDSPHSLPVSRGGGECGGERENPSLLLLPSCVARGCDMRDSCNASTVKRKAEGVSECANSRDFLNGLKHQTEDGVWREGLRLAQESDSNKSSYDSSQPTHLNRSPSDLTNSCTSLPQSPVKGNSKNSLKHSISVLSASLMESSKVQNSGGSFPVGCDSVETNLAPSVLPSSTSLIREGQTNVNATLISPRQTADSDTGQGNSQTSPVKPTEANTELTNHSTLTVRSAALLEENHSQSQPSTSWHTAVADHSTPPVSLPSPKGPPETTHSQPKRKRTMSDETEGVTAPYTRPPSYAYCIAAAVENILLDCPDDMRRMCGQRILSTAVKILTDMKRESETEALEKPSTE